MSGLTFREHIYIRCINCKQPMEGTQQQIAKDSDFMPNWDYHFEMKPCPCAEKNGGYHDHSS